MCDDTVAYQGIGCSRCTGLHPLPPEMTALILKVHKTGIMPVCKHSSVPTDPTMQNTYTRYYLLARACQ